MKSHYTVGDVVQFTGLTDRTVRKYISQGILEGELVGGSWQFTPEQVEVFMFHPSVRPSILAKKNAIVYDFLLEDKRAEQEACVILDIPGADNERTAEFFCGRINAGQFRKPIRFSFDAQAGKTPRVILEGSSREVLDLMNAYYAELG